MRSNQTKVIYSVIAICAIIWIVAYINIEDAKRKQSSYKDDSQAKKKELINVSQSLGIQDQTSQFKNKLREISASLNK